MTDVLIGYLDAAGAQDTSSISAPDSLTARQAADEYLAATGIAAAWVACPDAPEIEAALAADLGCSIGQPDGWSQPPPADDAAPLP